MPLLFVYWRAEESRGGRIQYYISKYRFQLYFSLGEERNADLKKKNNKNKKAFSSFNKSSIKFTKKSPSSFPLGNIVKNL